MQLNKPVTETPPPQTNIVDSTKHTFSVLSGPNRREMHFPATFAQVPQPTNFMVALPCGKVSLALSLLGDYFYSRFNAETILVNAHVVGINTDDGSKLLPEQASWEQALKQKPVRMSYNISQHTGKLFLPAAQA